ncbi:MAG: type II and III secretion system protein family protein [Planctomycetaceae bacterium]
MLSPGVFRAGTACAALLFILVAVTLKPACADPPAPKNALVFHVSDKTTQLSLTEKESRLLELDARIRTVDGFDPAVVKITTVDNFHQVRILALTPGYTTVVMVDEHGQSYTIDVLISGDVKQLEAVIRRAAPGSSVQALKVKDNVLLLGWVDQPSEATKIVELAEQFHPKVLNYLQVSGVQTIVLRVKIMEAQRSKIRDFGFNFLQLRQHSYVGSLPGPITPFAQGNPVVNLGNPFGDFLGPVSSAVNPLGATAVFGLVAADNAFQGFVEALKTENLLTILAEPNLVTTNGRPASFLAGGQFPVPVPQGLGTVSVVYKPFGVQLEFVPLIIGSGRLRMNVKPEVSDRDLSNTIVVGGISVPSLTTRAANTEVEMNFGETLVIAGMINNRVQARKQAVPFLGELPWIGAAFRRIHHDESETELLIMVTPELASPVDPACLPEGPGRGTVVPTDRELYFNGYLETPRYAPDPEPDISGYSSGAYVPPPAQFTPPMAPTPSGISPEPAYESPNGNGPRPGLPVPEILPPAEASAGAEVTQTSGIAPVRRGPTAKASSAPRGEPRSTKRKPTTKVAEKPSAAKSKASGLRQEERPGLIAP